MLSMQDALEVRIGGKEWHRAGHNYGLCIHMEAAEIIEHLGWKHWKDLNKEPDYNQIALELVDIWHFAMAHSLIACERDIDQCASDLFAAVNDLDGLGLQDMTMIDACLGMGYSMLTQQQFPLVNFVVACGFVELDFDGLYLLYCCKNVLNVFRQDRGYKEGLYLKTWAGREDNEHLMDLASEMNIDDISATVLYNALATRYEMTKVH